MPSTWRRGSNNINPERERRLARTDKERLAAGDPELTAELLGGLGETLDQKKKRLRKEARKKKDTRERKSSRGIKAGHSDLPIPNE